LAKIKRVQYIDADKYIIFHVVKSVYFKQKNKDFTHYDNGIFKENESFLRKVRYLYKNYIIFINIDSVSSR